MSATGSHPVVKLPASAAYRIAFAYTAAFACGIALLGVAIFYLMHARFVHEVDTTLTEEASALVEEFRTGGDAELGEAIAKRKAVDTRDLTGYAVYDRTGKRLYGSLEEPALHLGFQDLDMRDRKGQPDTGRALGVDLGQGKQLVVATDLEPVEVIDRTVITTFSAGFAVIAIFGIFAALHLGGYLRRRLETLSESARTIIAGNISHRMPIGTRNDEFDQLAATLNAMLERIEGLLDNLRQVSSDVAHDLRTPLTRLRNQLEAGEDQDAGQVIGSAIRQVDQILSLFAAILRISEIEEGQMAHRFERIDLSELVAEIAESYAPAIEDQGRTLHWQVEPGIQARADRDLLAQALVNLIENGQRHTPPGSTITVDLSQSRDCAVLSVADDGQGVDERDWSRITKRFVRLDRSRTSDGHGLGLNLVSAVAGLHGGTIAFADNSPGLIARILIPPVR